MKRVHARRLLPGLLAVAVLLLALPLRAQTLCVASRGGEGIGGTGRSSTPPGGGEGIGGSGRAPRGGGEGIGGTGVVGTITGFGSICVNGLEIDVEKARIDVDGSPASAKDLALGQVVAVEASGRADALSAARISVSTAVAGPLSRVDGSAGRLELVGQRVLVAPGVTLWDALRRRSLTLAELQDGEFVRISGLRRSDGVVVATRIERSSADVSRVSGPVELRDDGSVRIGSLRVNAGAARASLAPGRVVTAAGTIANGELTPTLLRVEPEIPFDGRLARLSLEGFVQDDVSGGRFRLGNLDVDASSFDASGAATVARDARIRVLGSLSDEARLSPETIEIETRDAESMRWTPLPAARPQRDAPRPERGAPPNPPGERTRPRAEERSRPERAAPAEPRRAERPESAERPRPAEPTKPERAERPERPDRMERPDPREMPRMERPEPPERPDRVEPPERPDRPERIDRPEPPERMERPEPPEMPRMERPEPPAPPERP